MSILLRTRRKRSNDLHMTHLPQVSHTLRHRSAISLIFCIYFADNFLTFSLYEGVNTFTLFTFC